MRVTWNGSLSFGLVSIPVGLAPATKPAARQSDVSFRLLHRECLTPIKQKRWCPKHDREVTNDELVKGWEVAKGQFVVVEESELEALERHDDSRTIDIERFVPLDNVDPVWMDRTYFLVPGAAPAQRRPYKLLLEAMEETEIKKAELELARQIVQGLAAEFEPAELTSDYRRDLRDLLEAKMRGEEIAIPEPTEEPAPAVDLIEALKASVAAAKVSSDRKKKADAKPTAERERRPARKAARK